MLDGLNADFGAVNLTSETPLHFAASQHNNALAAQLLLQRKVDVNAKNKKGETALHYAARSGLTEVAATLVTHGARMEQGEYGTPLQVRERENGRERE